VLDAKAFGTALGWDTQGVEQASMRREFSFEPVAGDPCPTDSSSVTTAECLVPSADTAADGSIAAMARLGRVLLAELTDVAAPPLSCPAHLVNATFYPL
jgi:hypothetical protein